MLKILNYSYKMEEEMLELEGSLFMPMNQEAHMFRRTTKETYIYKQA